MTEFRPALYIVGFLLLALGAAMLVPAVVDFAVDDIDWHLFGTSAMITGFTGGCLMFSMRGGGDERLSLRTAFLLTVLSWAAVSAFAALPFLLSNLNLSTADAVFEAVSGITTTGSTVLSGLDHMHLGILVWRSLLQWIGGLGIIVMAIALLPILRIGGMQLFHTESSDRSEKPFPRLRQVAGAFVLLYAVLTLTCAVALWLAGMGPFDAINHAMTTLSTGGFSTHDASIGAYSSRAIESVILVFMILGAITFTLHLRAVRGDFIVYFRDSQVRWFVAVLSAASLTVAIWITLTHNVPFLTALPDAAFNIVSVVTTTGFANADYMLWGAHAVAVFYFLTFVGGCTGSTSGGMKIFRFQVIYAVARQHLMRLIAPHRVAIARVQGSIIEESVALSVLGFFFFYALTFAVISILLSLFGLDPLTALSGAASAIGNVGPGLGPLIGPSGNFSSLPDGAKWVLAAGMLLGRLEFVTVFALLTHAFWRD